MEEVPYTPEFVQFVCAFCNERTGDDPGYAAIEVEWPLVGGSQALGAHGACLRAAVHASIPLAHE